MRNAPAIAKADRILAFLDMAPCCCQSLIGGLSFGWVMSQLCRRSELCEKQKAASKRKGVVGNNGKTAPITPKMRAIPPPAAHKRRLTGLMVFMASSILFLLLLPFQLIPFCVPEGACLLNR